MLENIDHVTALAKQLAGLMEMQANVQASMLQIQHYMHEMKSTQPDRSNNSVNNQKREEDLKLSNLPFFVGDDDAETYLDWESLCFSYARLSLLCLLLFGLIPFNLSVNMKVKDPFIL